MSSYNLHSDQKIVEAAQTLWDYMKMNQVVKPVAMIFVLCSHDDRVACYAAELYRQRISKRLLVSGGEAHADDLLSTKWKGTEAEHFAKVMKMQGVPANSIILETKARNTGDNITFGFKKLVDRNLHPDSLLIIQKPYMERRAYATFAKQ